MKILFTSALFLFLTSLSYAQDSYPDDCLATLEIPEAFSPNGDSNNDAFLIDFACPPEEFEFKMYDRWGKEIFASEDYRFKWNGSDDKNKELPAGTYIWSIKYTFNGAEVSKKGNVTLIR